MVPIALFLVVLYPIYRDRVRMRHFGPSETVRFLTSMRPTETTDDHFRMLYKYCFAAHVCEVTIIFDPRELEEFFHGERENIHALNE
jgi:hypothetical protein